MKATHLIEKLEELVDEYGNLEVKGKIAEWNGKDDTTQFGPVKVEHDDSYILQASPFFKVELD